MKKIILTMAIVGLISGCAGGPYGPNQTGGALTGAIVGGALGSMVGSGSGRAAAIAGGAIIGSMIGGNVGYYMDVQDRQRAAVAFERSRDGYPTAWTNPNTRTRYEVVPTNTYYNNGAPCREFTQTARIGGKTERVYGTACRQNDGSWKIVQ